MFTVLALASALATPPGFEITREGIDGCTLFLGEKQSDGVVPMRAECHWPDVTAETFDRVMRAWDDQEACSRSVQASDVLSTVDDTTYVRQVHVTSGISDRHIVLAATREALDCGGSRHAWTKADRPLEVPGGDVEAARSDGSWQACPAEGGGVDVVYQLAYDPAGRVPGFLVRWFQTSGLAAIVTDLHECLVAQADE